MELEVYTVEKVMIKDFKGVGRHLDRQVLKSKRKSTRIARYVDGEAI